MMIQAESIHALQALANDYKFWLTAVGFIGACYKVVNWVKDIRTKDVPELHKGVKELKAGLDTLSIKLDAQTSSVVGELKELRSDFRTLYVPHAQVAMMPVRSKAPKKKLTTKSKKGL